MLPSPLTYRPESLSYCLYDPNARSRVAEPRSHGDHILNLHIAMPYLAPSQLITNPAPYQDEHTVAPNVKLKNAQKAAPELGAMPSP